MKLQQKLSLMVTALLALSLIPTSVIVSWIARQSLIKQAESNSQIIAQLVSRSTSFADRIPNTVEDVLGQQMVAEAVLSSHLVAIATQAGLSPQEIIQHLKTIVDRSVIDEFWITDEQGNAYLTNIDNVHFTFNPDPKIQPQAHIFWPLLTGEKNTVIQEARKREIDDNYYKYVGVSGIDKKRIVQVGYKQEFLLKLRQELGLKRLINQLLENKNMGAIYILDRNHKIIAEGTSNRFNKSLFIQDQKYIKTLFDSNRDQPLIHFHPNWLTVVSPFYNEKQEIMGATLVYISTDELTSSMKFLKEFVILFSTIIIILGIIISLLIAKRITEPLLNLSHLADNVAQGNWDQHLDFSHADTEIKNLANVFNTMTKHLQESFTNLEDKVKQRTEELSSAYDEIQMLNNLLKADNIRMSSELEITRKLQQMILPKDKELQQITALDIAGFMQPASEVGGDYYDVLYHERGVKIGIGDVTGHGLESGVLMIMVQTAVRTLLENQEVDAKRVLDTINRTIYHNVQRMSSDKNLTLALLDYEEGKIRLSGQHEEIIIIRKEGKIECIDTIDLGFPIGLEVDIIEFIDQREIHLKEGDGVVLYTDGITEAENMDKIHYGLPRLCTVVQKNWSKSSAEIRKAVIDDLRCHIGDQKVYDDITLVVIKQK